MFIRVVKMTCKKGMEEEMRKIGRERLVPINREAGCIAVYFLEPDDQDQNPDFGVVSLWEKRETLQAMKGSEKYRQLLQELAPLEEGSSDVVFTSK